MKNLFSELFLSKGVNYYSGDKPLQAALDFFSLKRNKELDELGLYVSEELIELLDFIDHSAKPVLHTWNTLGKRIDYVRISPEHFRALLKLQELGVISSLLKGSKSLMQHFVSGYVVSDSGIFCTLTLTAQTAYAIDKYATDSVRNRYLKNFLNHENPWFGATFYTETQGGSDLGANVTSAQRSGDNFLLSGTDKYFASNAGVADAAVVTAREDKSAKGAKGISVFLVPAYLEDGSLNYSIRRIKDKMGTVAVPTGEVEFDSSMGYLLGNEGQGIYIAMEILTISRIDDAIAAVGIARKALWEAVKFAGEREAFGRKIIEHPLMLRDLVEREAELVAAMVVALLAGDRFDHARDQKPPYGDEYQYARLLSSVAKNMASETSAEITRYAMETEGGIGFLEEFPMAKFHRDSIVTSIWEGTSNIQALEFLEVLAKKNGVKILFAELASMINEISDGRTSSALSSEAGKLRSAIEKMLASEEPQFDSKEVLAETGRLLAAVYMSRMGESPSENSVIMKKNAEIYIKRHYSTEGLTYRDVKESAHILDWMRK